MRQVMYLMLACAVCGPALGDDTETASPTDEDRLQDTIVFVHDPVETIRVFGLYRSVGQFAPASVTVLDETGLALRDTGLVADQLRAAPGVAVSRSGATGSLTQVRMRGAEANHTTVLLNGIDISDPTTGETDFGLISGLYLKRIEIARGEQSTFRGSGAIGGIINLETQWLDGTQLKSEYGTQGTHRLEAGWGILNSSSGNVSAYLSDYETGGVDTSGLSGEKDGSTARSVVVTADSSILEDWQISGLFRYGTSEVATDPDADFDGRLENADRQTHGEQWTAGAVANGFAAGLKHEAILDFNAVTRDDFGDGNPLSSTDGSRLRASLTSGWDTVGVGSGDLSVFGQIDHRIEDYEVRDTAFGGLTDQDQTFHSTALAAQAEWLADLWLLSASARWTHNAGDLSDATSWRIGFAREMFTGAGIDGRIRGSVGTGFKNPTFTELFGFFPSSFVGNPNLEVETSRSAELGFDWQSDLFNHRLEGSATVFAAELENEIFTRFTPGFLATADNRSGTSNRHGAEFSATLNDTEPLRFSGSLTWTQSEDDSGRTELRVPEWTGSFAISWTQGEGGPLTLSAGADYVGEQIDTDFSTFRRVTLDDYVLLSARGEYRLSPRLFLTLRGEDLADEAPVDVVGYNSAGRSLHVGLSWR